MVFSKSTEYAIKTLTCIIKSGDGRFYGVKELSEKLEIKSSYLTKVLQRLQHAGFLTSSTGPHGGFALVAGKETAPLAAVIRLMESEELFNGCFLGLSQCGADKNPCPYHKTWSKFKTELLKESETVTLQDAAKRFWPALDTAPFQSQNSG